jgi:hypothetical protein
MEITQKLEASPMYQYFAKEPDRICQGRPVSLARIRRDLLDRNYQSAEEWVTDLSTYFHAITGNQKAAPVEKHAAQALFETVVSKSHYLECEMTIDAWKESWCEAYQEVSQLIAAAPPKVSIAGHAHLMQLRGIDVEISEPDILKMKQAIEQNLNDEKRDVLARLVLTLEPDTTIEAGDEIVFDLARLKKATLIAVRTFVQNQTSQTRAPVALFDEV